MQNHDWDVGSLVTVTYQRESFDPSRPPYPRYEYVGRVVAHTDRGYKVKLDSLWTILDVKFSQVSAPPILDALADV
ncbi:MAG: hypothetical protein AB7L09_02230 [Nitrospira sp.]